MEYHLLTDDVAIEFLNYYEKRLFNYGTSVPSSSIWAFLSGNLALKADYYEHLKDKDQGQILRFYYRVSDYELIFDVWQYQFAKMGTQNVCLVEDGSIHGILNKKAYKEWQQWLWLDRILLPLMFLGMTVSSITFIALGYLFRHSIKWYYLLIGGILLLLYAILITKFCFHYWKNHKYLKVWLDSTKENVATDHLERR